MPRLVADDIASALRKRIDAGEWTEQGRIPPERVLADEFGAARNTVRRAVGLLEESGTVVRQIGRGTFLAAANANTLAAAVTRMQGTSPADMMEIRQLLEPAAAAFAATNASVGELNAVREAYQAATDALDMPTFEQWDAEFHHRIFACSRNEFLKEIHNLMRVLRNQSPWFEMKKARSRRSAAGPIARNQAILGALVSRDRDGARAAMLSHLQTVERNLYGGAMIPRAVPLRSMARRIGEFRGSRPRAARLPVRLLPQAGLRRGFRSSRLVDHARRRQGVALPLRAGHGRLRRLPRVRRLCRGCDDRGRKIVVGGDCQCARRPRCVYRAGRARGFLGRGW